MKVRRILVIRFQAIGDVVITLPWLQSLKDQLPESEIHFLTRDEAAPIPEALTMFSKVIRIGGGRNTKLQLLHVLLLIPVLKLRRYDVVIDLQGHWISRLIRKLVHAGVWSEFDRFGVMLAGEKTRLAIDAAGLAQVGIPAKIRLQETFIGFSDRHASLKPYVILNPAGAFITRHWPLDRFAEFAERWSAFQPEAKFMILGLPSLSTAAEYLSAALGDRLINLVGKTTAVDAFQYVAGARLVVTEDSGLLHMAWTQRIPTVAIFGSTRSDWSSPMGEWSFCFNSSDLPCGNCMLEKCRFGDNRCLTRVSVDEVFDTGVRLVTRAEKKL